MRILITILLLSAPFNAQARSERCWLVSAEADTSIAAGAITTDAIDMSKGHRVDATKPIPSHLKIGLDLTDAGSGVSSLVLTFSAAEALAGTYRVVTEDAGSTAIVLSYDWDPSTAGKNWMIDVSWSSPFGKVTATPTGHGAGDTLQMTIYGCTGDAPPRSPAISETGLVTADIDLDTGGYQLILDDGATGAGNGSRYYGQDTDLNWYRSAANTETLEGSLAITGNTSFGGILSPSSTYGMAVLFLLTDTQPSVLTVDAMLTVPSGSSNQFGSVFALTDITIDSGNVHGRVSTVSVNKPTLTLTSGSTVDYASTLEIWDAPTGGTLGNYALRVISGLSYFGGNVAFGGDIQTAAATDWDLVDNNASALSFDAAGKAGILELSTVNADEGVKMSGYLNVTGQADFADNVYVGAGKFVALDGGKFYPDKDDASVSVATTGTGVLDLNGTPLFDDYTRHHDVQIGAAIVGAAAPGEETIGTYRCKVFDANADLAYINVEVPTEWNGSSDMAIDLLIFTDDGDVLGNGETIEFDLVYRSVAVGEAYDNGTAVTILANVTGGGAEVDKGQYKITATVDYDDTDQPLAVNDTLGFSIMRDVTTGDTYSGDVHVCRAQLVYTANALATH